MWSWGSLAIALLSCCGSVRAAGDFYLHPPERILFCGDGPAIPQLMDVVFLETFFATRFPRRALQLLHGGCDRLRPEDLGSGRPTVAVLIASPSGSGSAYRAAYERSAELKSRVPNLRISILQRVIPAAREPDAPLTAALDLLASWNAPATVSVVRIDAPAKRVVSSENTRVRELESDRVVAWSQDDEALPLPAAAPFTARAAKMNVERLEVDGLSAGEYKLLIDGWLMGTFWREMFAEGIDLTLLPTPMIQQAAGVHRLALEHQKLGTDPLSDETQQREADLMQRLREASMPVTHDYEIVPVDR